MAFFDHTFWRSPIKATYVCGAGTLAAVWIIASSAKAGTCNGPAAEWAPLTYPGLDTVQDTDLTGLVMLGAVLIVATLYFKARNGFMYPG